MPEPRRSLRDRKQLQAHPKYKDYYSGLIGEVEYLTVEQALNDMDWRKSMKEEMTSLQKMNTWILTELAKGRQARGYDQKAGVDYYETFAPVVRHSSIRLILSHAAKENYYIETFDVKTAFLNGTLTEDIYMNQPKGFDDNSGRVCKLIKSIYGLKQAPKAWNTKISNLLEKWKLHASDDDPCVFYNEERSIILAIFVDDGLITGKSKQEVKNTILKLSKEF